MSNYEDADRAKDLIIDFWDKNRWRTRHIGTVRIRVVSDHETRDEEVRDFHVVISVTKSKYLPPKFSTAIDGILCEEGLGHVPVKYLQVTEAHF